MISWDGTQFLYTYDGQSSYYWEFLKLIRKYGFSPIKVSSSSMSTIDIPGPQSR